MVHWKSYNKVSRKMLCDLCSNLTITQVLEIIMESNQTPKKANIHRYKFNVYTNTQLEKQMGEKHPLVDVGRQVWGLSASTIAGSQEVGA